MFCVVVFFVNAENSQIGWLYLKVRSYICLRILVRKFMSHEHDEKGTPCESGAVPAAVNSNRKQRFTLLNYMPLFRR